MSRPARMLFPLIVVILSLGWEDSDRNTATNDFGKIYLRDNYLLLSELTRGIRFLDISDPASPTEAGLIEIAGNHDMALASTAMGGDVYLYVDSHAHLIVYEVSDPLHPVAVETLYNVFQAAHSIGWGEPRPFDAVVVGARGCGPCDGLHPGPAEPTLTFDARGTGSSTGRGGSLARFAVVDEYLYCIDYNQLYVFEITNPAEPRFISRVHVGWGIETLFPYREHLFIGGQNGMFVYSRANPALPQYVSIFRHVRSCDPVVVEDTLAYVTLRGGTQCGTVVSALHLVGITDVSNPTLIASYPLPQPMGLDVSDRIAFVCDASSGVYILDAADPRHITQLAHLPGESGYDAIKNAGLLIVGSRSNVSLYNVSSPSHPVLLSRYGSQ